MVFDGTRRSPRLIFGQAVQRVVQRRRVLVEQVIKAPSKVRRPDGGRLVETEVDAFVGKRWLITVRKDDRLPIEPVLERWDRSPRSPPVGSAPCLRTARRDHLMATSTPSGPSIATSKKSAHDVRRATARTEAAKAFVRDAPRHGSTPSSCSAPARCSQ